MKLLVVGGTGVLSTAVVKEALARGLDVSVINRGHRKHLIPEGVELIQADVRDADYLRAALSGRRFDAVIDFICYNREQISHSLDLFGDVAEQYIFISSSCVYDTSLPGAKAEDAPKGLQAWSYSTDKWACEEYLAGRAAEEGINYTVVRPCVTYDDTRIPYGIMPAYGYHWTLAARILAGKPVITWDGGAARWNMMRVEDFAVGIVGLVGNPLAYGEAFNICGDEPVSWSEVLDTLGRILGREVKRLDISSGRLKQFCPDRAGEISGRARDAIIDNARIKRVVPEFRQRISLEEGIRRTLDAYRSQQYQRGIDWQFDALWDSIAGRPRCVNYLGTASLRDRLVYFKNFFVR